MGIVAIGRSLRTVLGAAKNPGEQKQQKHNLANEEEGKQKKVRVRGKNDPKYKLVTRYNSETGQDEQIAVERDIPDYIPAHDRKILKDARRLAYRYDLGLSIGPFPIGIESALGWIPGIGDFIGVFMASTVFMQCMRVKGHVPFGKKFHMAWNIFVDFLIGLVPLAGDIFDMGFKANSKNVLILDEFLREKHYTPGVELKRPDAGLYASADPENRMDSLQGGHSEPASHKWYEAGRRPHQRPERTASSRPSAPQHAPPSRWEEPRHAPQPSSKPLPQRPVNSYQREHVPSSRSYFGWNKKQRPVDPEMGEMPEMRRGPPVVAARA